MGPSAFSRKHIFDLDGTLSFPETLLLALHRMPTSKCSQPIARSRTSTSLSRAFARAFRHRLGLLMPAPLGARASNGTSSRRFEVPHRTTVSYQLRRVDNFLAGNLERTIGRPAQVAAVRALLIQYLTSGDTARLHRGDLKPQISEQGCRRFWRSGCSHISGLFSNASIRTGWRRVNKGRAAAPGYLFKNRAAARPWC
jgi:hypothetical protein